MGGGNAMLSLFANYQTLLVIALIGFVAGVLVAVFMGHRYRGVLHALQKAYDLLHHQEQRRKTIVEELPVGLEVYDMNGILLRRNRQVCKILGEPVDCQNTLLTNPQVPERIRQAFEAGGKSALILHIVLPILLWIAMRNEWNATGFPYGIVKAGTSIIFLF